MNERDEANSPAQDLTAERILTLLAGSEASADPEFATLEAEVGALLKRAEALPQASWGGAPPLELDVEAALSRVLATTSQASQRRGRWRSRVLRMTTSAAAALLLFTLSAPVFLRYRIERRPSGSDAAQAMRPSESVYGASAVFWTSPR